MRDEREQRARQAGALRQAGRPRTIALTGAASFLGQNLIGLFEEDGRVERVVAFDVKAPATAGKKTRFCELDLTRPTAGARVAEVLRDEGVDALAHLAFLAEPSHTEAYAHELEAVGTMYALDGARRADVRKVVLWSQTLLYGARPSNPNFLTEEHPLRAGEAAPYFADKVEAEALAGRYAEAEGAVVTVLRTAPLLGPTVRNYMTRFLARRFVPTLLGFDPLWQFLHEVDAVAAFRLALLRDCPGTFNIVGEGVLPLSTVVRLAGRAPLPLPHPLARPLSGALWLAQLADLPPGFVDYLRYVCVADGAKAAEIMGFRPAFTTREALLDFAGVQRLRDVRLAL
ncbi:MAG TPA: NAD-dependent epimerase/dehydratase family protein [Polyangiaceae bacterium]|nr:NAD-dependent epimerase/dehydratase family protein [Polyangiaceae bacterium]